jgi:serine/threonine protein kinase
LLERIGTGGMAELFRAKIVGEAGFEKELAVKKVLPHLSEDEEFIRMFKDEANISASLTHGNIISVIDFVRLEREYYLVMEYVDGISLIDLIDCVAESGKFLPASIAAYIALEVCKGLDYIHRKTGPDGRCLKIVHRDISAENILISYSGQVKIVDFGIARAQGRIYATQDGVLKGKMTHLSPEQVAGNKADHRSDIYSVGITLYEMLTNELPYDGTTNERTMALIRRGEFENPRNFNLDVPEKLTAVVSRALEPDSDLRYQAASDMALDLRTFLQASRRYPSARLLAGYVNKLARKLNLIREQANAPKPYKLMEITASHKLDQTCPPEESTWVGLYPRPERKRVRKKVRQIALGRRLTYFLIAFVSGSLAAMILLLLLNERDRQPPSKPDSLPAAAAIVPAKQKAQVIKPVAKTKSRSKKAVRKTRKRKKKRRVAKLARKKRTRKKSSKRRRRVRRKNRKKRTPRRR